MSWKITDADVDVESNKMSYADKKSELLKNSINNVILAFRLVKSDFIEANIKIERSEPASLTYLYSDHGLKKSFIGFLYWGSKIGKYKIDVDQINEVRALAKKLSEVDFSKRVSLRIALGPIRKIVL